MTEDSEELPNLEMGFTIKNRFAVEKKLGEGGYGAVYRVSDNVKHVPLAMKVEKQEDGVLKMEVTVLQQMEIRGGKHCCEIIERGRTRGINYVIMTLIGPSLFDLRREMPPEYKFSLSSSLRSAIQCLEAVRDLHKIGFIHRDIKPTNFAIGRVEVKDHRTVYVLDFGLARQYIGEDGQIKSPRKNAGFRGTARYAPIQAHLREDLGRKDDLETWFYQTVELTVGKLPWRNMTQREAVRKSKEGTRLTGSLYEGCPTVYRKILAYIDTLKFYQEPAYDYIEEGLRHAMKRNNIKDEDPYDWEKDDCVSAKKTFVESQGQVYRDRGLAQQLANLKMKGLASHSPNHSPVSRQHHH